MLKPTLRLLSRHDALWRVRVGDWQIVHEMRNGALIVLVLALGPRGGIYEQMER